jgi:hypothetical protein
MITVPTLLITCFIGVLFGDIGAYISILGGFCSVTQVFLVPVLIYVKSNDYPIYHWKNLTSIILVIFLCGIGYTAGVISILNVINKSN